MRSADDARALGLVRGELVTRVVVSTPTDPYMTLRAAADYLGVSPRSVEHFTALAPDRALPCYRLPSGKRLWRRSDIDAWMAQHRSVGRPNVAAAIRALGLDRPVRHG